MEYTKERSILLATIRLKQIKTSPGSIRTQTNFQIAYVRKYSIAFFQNSHFILIISIFIAYCGDGLPGRPVQASEAFSQSKNGIGQIVTYTCNTGFEFVGAPVEVKTDIPVTTAATNTNTNKYTNTKDPTVPTTTTTTTTTTTIAATTTIASDWKDFSGASYLFVEEKNTGWQAAQDACIALGGQLASITSQEVQNFLDNNFKFEKHTWIGANDKDVEGTFKWVKGETWLYKNWKSGEPNGGDSRDCTYIEKNKLNQGSWKDEACDKTWVGAYLCQKGTSTSFGEKPDSEWKTFSGSQYKLYPYSSKVSGWTGAQGACQADRAKLASITSQEIQTFLTDTYGFNNLAAHVWIGGNDKDVEGTFKWDNGDTWGYSNWKTNEPDGGDSHDCIYIERNQGGVWKDYDCNKKYAYLCMKAVDTIAVADWRSFSGAEFALQADSSITGWQDAKDACTALGAKLASVHTKEVLKFLIATLLSQSQTTRAWIGGYFEGSYKWDNGETWDYTNWNKGEPSSSNCVAIGQGGKWKDNSCTRAANKNYICMKGTVSRKKRSPLKSKFSYYCN